MRRNQGSNNAKITRFTILTRTRNFEVVDIPKVIILSIQPLESSSNGVLIFFGASFKSYRFHFLAFLSIRTNHVPKSSTRSGSTIVTSIGFAKIAKVLDCFSNIEQVLFDVVVGLTAREVNRGFL